MTRPGSIHIANSSPQSADLQREASIIAEYLLECQPPAALLERYVAGVAAVIDRVDSPVESRMRSFILRHPGTIRFFDAAAAISSRKNNLRKRILLMVAILETTPAYCDRFFETPISKTRFVLTILALASKTALHAAIGILLTLWIRLQKI